MKAAWDRYQAYKKNGEKKMKDASLFEEYDDMSDIEAWYQKDVAEEPPAQVIPESFLWVVFD